MRYSLLVLIVLVCALAVGGAVRAPTALARSEASIGTDASQEKRKKKRKKRGRAYVHRVKPGDALSRIARDYGVKVSEIKQWNALKSDTIYVGRELRVYPRVPVRVTRILKHVVEKGETIGGIAARYKVSKRSLMKANGIRDPRRLRAGKTLKIKTRAPAILSEATGRPQRGKLINGEALPEGNACYRLKRPHNAWGTNETVEQLTRAIGDVCSNRKLWRKRKKAPQLVVGDLSRKGGGPLARHKSHQNGRDADVGLFHRNATPRDFVKATRKNIDLPATWALINAFRKADAYDYIFLDRKIQRWLGDWLVKTGRMSRRKVRDVFRYPRGTARALIRHEKGHLDHMHIRFRCPSSDLNCY